MIIFNFRKPLAWILYPVIIYIPFKWLVLNHLRFLSSADGYENQQRSLEFFVMIVMFFFTLFCLSIAIYLFLKRVEFPNKNLKNLRELITIPDNVRSAHWLQYETETEKGLNILLFCSTDKLEHVIQGKVEVNQLNLPNWVHKYIKTSELKWVNGDRFKQNYSEANLYAIDDTLYFLNIVY